MTIKALVYGLDSSKKLEPKNCDEKKRRIRENSYGPKIRSEGTDMRKKREKTNPHTHARMHARSLSRNARILAKFYFEYARGGQARGFITRPTSLRKKMKKKKYNGGCKVASWSERAFLKGGVLF